MSKPIWWEKTVEYKFVRQFIKDNHMIAPLDGKHEAAGDAILGLGLKWVLIEFKKDASSINSEIEKFGNRWIEAKKSLTGKDTHHFLIFGQLSEVDGKLDINLRAVNYFSLNKIKCNEIFSCGVDPETFNAYLVEFAKFKETVSSSGGMDLQAYEQVMGVNANGEVVACASLKEFGLALGKHYVHQQEKQRTRSYDRGMSM
ncbi:hypothetical protein [Chromobacterium sp. IIBBL 290-4]|uniref:hypothetical protein n=1 Tax=Chromobacterium sp. IIBBL 290-4 TaxID=2953890 RepID=UPI0020B8EF8B|nr:hypothetical protein [Chromobacterium sp. IIBBL 290-4]UTH73346.1 hypothetical protein NKT35_17665 [Chromobacterium sp. IIBBL 290-4]